MKKKALFFDIDGTLLSEVTGQVPESAIEALKQAQECGHLTFINTGRTICSIPGELKQLPFNGFICGCGTYISYQDEVIFSKSIPHERGRDHPDDQGVRCGYGSGGTGGLLFSVKDVPV